MTDLHPIDVSLLPFQVGEKVAFREDHEDHPGMYGVVQAVGVEEDGSLAFDVAVHDPAEGMTEDDKVFRAKMGDIQ